MSLSKTTGIALNNAKFLILERSATVFRVSLSLRLEKLIVSHGYREFFFHSALAHNSLSLKSLFTRNSPSFARTSRVLGSVLLFLGIVSLIGAEISELFSRMSLVSGRNSSSILLIDELYFRVYARARFSRV